MSCGGLQIVGGGGKQEEKGRCSQRHEIIPGVKLLDYANLNRDMDVICSHALLWSVHDGEYEDALAWRKSGNPLLLVPYQKVFTPPSVCRNTEAEGGLCLKARLSVPLQPLQRTYTGFSKAPNPT